MKKIMMFLSLTAALTGCTSQVDCITPKKEKIAIKTETKKTTKKVVNNESKEKEVEAPVAESIPIITSSSIYSGQDLQYSGVIYWSQYKWTWYSEKVLPGGGLNIPGRHADEQGFICDIDGYICLASSTLAQGTVVATPFGKNGKIYDSGCAVGTLDVYVNW